MRQLLNNELYIVLVLVLVILFGFFVSFCLIDRNNNHHAPEDDIPPMIYQVVQIPTQQ
jgi:hypothetical protein